MSEARTQALERVKAEVCKYFFDDEEACGIVAEINAARGLSDIARLLQREAWDWESFITVVNRVQPVENILLGPLFIDRGLDPVPFENDCNWSTSGLLKGEGYEA